MELMTVLSRTIYLNRNGATLTPGVNNSRTDTSSLIGKVEHIEGWDATPEEWAELVACTRSTWAAYDVTITDVDPVDSPHIEVLIGGASVDLGLEANWGGVSPFMGDCTALEHSIVFAFTDNLGGVTNICQIVAQEIGHSYGLDHEVLPGDLMSWSGLIDRSFVDQDSACGEFEPRDCVSKCRPSQNSHRILLERLGSSDPEVHRGSDVLTEAPGAPMHGHELGCSAAGDASIAVVLLAALLVRR